MAEGQRMTAADVVAQVRGVSTFRTPKTQPGRAPSIARGRWCSTQTGHAHQPAPGASQRPVPTPRPNLHHCAAPLHEPSTRVQAIRPSGLPLARGQRMDRQPFGFPLGFAPRDHSQRTPGQGRSSQSTSPKPALRHQPNLQPRGFTWYVRPRVARVEGEVSDGARLSRAAASRLVGDRPHAPRLSAERQLTLFASVALGPPRRHGRRARGSRCPSPQRGAFRLLLCQQALQASRGPFSTA